jgi:comEA protein
MTEDKLNRFWLLATFLLILIIILGSIIIWTRHDRGSPLEISSPPSVISGNSIYVEGAGTSPGIYPLKEGGKTQLIDLNGAELWLLESLPGIGAIRAQAIIDYRTQNGPFRDIHEIINVPGIGASTFEKIKEYIIVMP